MSFGGGRRELWGCKSELSGGMLDLPCSGTKKDCGSGWVNINLRGTLSQVYTAGSTIEDGSVNKRKWKRYGRLWVGVRYRGGVIVFGR